mmetsp:Transcript_30915/g.67848  ORF Transcript_30915/g.67848 Transcript_30915/m.67848 type:complete len:205 (+) Transcript_30915:1551-2165(+)
MGTGQRCPSLTAVSILRRTSRATQCRGIVTSTGAATVTFPPPGPALPTNSPRSTNFSASKGFCSNNRPVITGATASLPETGLESVAVAPAASRSWHSRSMQTLPRWNTMSTSRTLPASSDSVSTSPVKVPCRATLSWIGTVLLGANCSLWDPLLPAERYRSRCTKADCSTAFLLTHTSTNILVAQVLVSAFPPTSTIPLNEPRR